MKGTVPGDKKRLIPNMHTKKRRGIGIIIVDQHGQHGSGKRDFQTIAIIMNIQGIKGWTDD
jgi:hypothetical protein